VSIKIDKYKYNIAFIYSLMNANRIPPDYAGVTYAVGIQQGGEEEWDYVWNKSMNTRVASEAEVMMNALAHTRHEWLLWR